MGRHRRKRNQALPQEQQLATVTDGHVSYRRTKIFVLIFAILAIVAIIATAITSAVISAINSERVDYLKDDLSKYIYIDPADYKSYDVHASVDPIDELAVEDYIMQMLYDYRDATLAFGGQWLVNLPKNAAGEVTRKLGIGDAVEYRYRAYTVRDDGSRDYLGEGFCNFGSESATEVGIGEGITYLGFEYGLIGKDHGEYSKLTKITDRPVAEGDFIKLTYSKVTPDTQQERVTEYISVKAEDCDPIYGEGFASFLIGKSLGEVDGFFVIDNGDGTKSSYLGVSIGEIYDVGDNPLTVEARTSVNETEEKLAGITIYYDVYVERVKLLENTPKLDPMFVAEKLKMSPSVIEKYDGESFDEKFRSYVVEKLEEVRESEITDVIEDAMWEHYHKVTKVKRLPEGEVLDYYNDYVAELTAKYNAAADNYNSIEEYAMLDLGLGRDENWLDYMRNLAEKSVTEKIIFYYIIRNEKISPTKEEYDELYAETVESTLQMILDQVGCRPDGYATVEEYNKAVESYRKSMMKTYGEEYFDEVVIYLHAIEKLRGYANVVYDR